MGWKHEIAANGAGSNAAAAAKQSRLGAAFMPGSCGRLEEGRASGWQVRQKMIGIWTENSTGNTKAVR